MIKLVNLVNNFSKTNLQIDRICDIKTYLPVKDKAIFVNEYFDLVKEHIDDFNGAIEIVLYTFFHLLVVKYYTNIELDLTYESFDMLQENRMMNKIIEIIGEDYDLLKQFIKIKK